MTKGFLAFKLRDGRIKGTACRWDGYPTGFGRMIIDVLQKAQFNNKYTWFAQRMDTIEWVKRKDRPPDGVMMRYILAGFSSDPTQPPWAQASVAMDLTYESLLKIAIFPTLLFESTMAGALHHWIDDTDLLEDLAEWCDFTYTLDLHACTIELSCPAYTDHDESYSFQQLLGDVGIMERFQKKIFDAWEEDPDLII